MGNTYAQRADALRMALENRSERYGAQWSEFKTEHLVSIIGTLIAKWEDGSGNATEGDIHARIKAAFPVSKKVHKSRQ